MSVSKAQSEGIKMSGGGLYSLATTEVDRNFIPCQNSGTYRTRLITSNGYLMIRGQINCYVISRFHRITRIDPVRHATMAYTNQVIQPLHTEAGKGCLGTAP